MALLVHPASRLQRVRPLVIGPALTAAATLALHVRDPHVSGSWGFCPWLALTGTYCPGCGGLRAVNDLTHGDLGAALSSNVLFVIAIPLILGWWMVAFRRAWSGSRMLSDQGALRLSKVLIVVGLVFWVVRNLPGLEWLRP